MERVLRIIKRWFRKLRFWFHRRRLVLVVFDWNGTLLDDLPLIFESVLEIFRRYDVPPPTLEEYRREITADFMPFYWNHGIPREATADDLNKIRIEVLNRTDPARHVLVWGTKGLLEFCRGEGIKVAMVSAGNREVIGRQLDQLEITPYFELILTDARDKEKALRDALAFFGAKPFQAVYVDDTFDGLTAARRVGMKACGVAWGYNTEDRIEEAQPDFILELLLDLIDILARAD